MRLCFGFVLQTVLTTQGCFLYCWAVLTQTHGLLCLSPHPTGKQAEAAQEAGRGHSQDSRPQLTKGISYTIQHHPQRIKWREEEGMGGCSERWDLSTQLAITHHGALLSWRWLNTHLRMRRSELIPCFALLVPASFALPTKLSLSQPRSFLTFTLPSLSPTPLGESERLCRAKLLTGIKSQELDEKITAGLKVVTI